MELEWLKKCIIRDFFVPKYDKYTLYEEKYKINKDDVVLDIGGSCRAFVYKIQDGDIYIQLNLIL